MYMNETIFLFTNDIFFRNLSFLRKKNCLSRRALAHLWHMCDYWIKSMEEGTWGNKLPVSKLIRISQIFDVDLNDLVTKDLSIQ
jgi:hypothetical protein